jgi:hypothetical protein
MPPFCHLWAGGIEFLVDLQLEDSTSKSEKSKHLYLGVDDGKGPRRSLELLLGKKPDLIKGIGTSFDHSLIYPIFMTMAGRRGHHRPNLRITRPETLLHIQ